MRERRAWSGAAVMAAAIIAGSGCSDKGSEPPAPQPGVLTAVPAAVTIAGGQTVRVAISGGTLPYTISAQADPALASAVFEAPATEPDTLVITAVTVASVPGSTTVRVHDSSPSPGRDVSVPITRNP